MLSPPALPLRDFWVTVCVLFVPPQTIEGGGLGVEEGLGYYQQIGLRTVPEKVRTLLEQVITDGGIDWEETGWYEMDPANLHRQIRRIKRRVTPVEGEGVWYRGGRALFSER